MEIVYTKLFQFIRENTANNTNVILAKILIINLNRIKNMSVEATAYLCNCSPSTLNRFCNTIGLKNFRYLKKLLNLPKSICLLQDFNQDLFLEHINANLAETNAFLNSMNLDDLIYKIHSAKRIIFIGYQDNQSYTLEFQCKMIELNKYVETIGFLDISNKIDEFTKNDLVIFISFQGNLFVGHNGEILDAVKRCQAPTLLISQINNKELINEFTYFIKCGSYSYYGEGKYALMYILNILYFKYSNFLLSH